jgi:hypothetical protein
LVLVSGAVSVALMHDWIAWNSARWDVGRRGITVHRIHPWDIEGGFEWNGWFDPGVVLPPVPPDRRGQVLAFTASYFPHVSGRYLISLTHFPGIRCLEEEPYTLWLLPGETRACYLLKWPERKELMTPGAVKGWTAPAVVPPR